ncbi:hypothetical protein AQUCO_00600440v1 [Aquilegia coerulea]|uniref:Glycosyltransferase n=1 Tax=Aquilegia coerulea TaxID=218851 RepID=A0A2G5EPM5_AQUCA|nr:hypothetical protein AQUCO_00600440v1 [Aquilegia coerulea]
MAKLTHILVVPFPAQGHVMPLMEFSNQLLINHGLKVTFVNMESIHNKLVASKLEDHHHKEEKEDSRIHLVSIPERDPDLGKFVEYVSETMSLHLEKLIKKFNESDDEKIDFIIVDAFVANVFEVAKKFGINGAAFFPTSLGYLALMLYFSNLIEAGDIDEKGNPLKDEDIKLPLGMPANSTIDLIWALWDEPNMQKGMLALAFNVNKAAKTAKWILSNSPYELEPASHDLIPNILTVGPLLPRERLGLPKGQLMPEDSSCLTWLCQQPAKSVIYVAFGSTTCFTHSQFNELVHGLELVNGPLLWVVRAGLTDEVTTPYLDGFKNRMVQRGKIVDWAPQYRVLAHPSIACFITHCGWNSTMEGLSNGVPLLCWPYFGDQVHTENYICDNVKVGLRFKKDENGIITRSEIQTKIQELLGDEGIRSRANKLKDVIKTSTSEGGSSSKNIEDFINCIKL